MWQAAGICRDRANLDRAIIQVELWQTEFDALALSRAIAQLSPPQAGVLPKELPDADLRTWGETRNLLDIARSILTGATRRTESRGGHYRTDFPAIDPDWQTHTLVSGDSWSKSQPIRS
jgi:L-aspartate oxidase